EHRLVVSFCWPDISQGLTSNVAYAKFPGAPLKVHKITNLWRNPTGTSPALKTTEESIGSLSKPSNVIIQLIKQKYNADYDLSAKEGADTLASMNIGTRLRDGHGLPVFSLWINKLGAVDVTRRWNARTSPSHNFLLPNHIHNQQLERLRLVRRDPTLEPGHQLEKLYHDVLECMNLLSHRLVQKPYCRDGATLCIVSPAHPLWKPTPLLKVKLPNGKLHQHLNSQDNLRHYCTNGLVLYFPSEEPELRLYSDGSDFDNEPHKQRNQILFAMGSMLGYAILMGIVSIQHV
uniref:Mitochondrial outer membrane transport complex Sam37/metaxin N-terminal domain-containing protein n=1 Tax=Oncorhynchus kisutch TaxID=8019 RepID=A0A8C7GUV1_ONCKI